MVDGPDQDLLTISEVAIYLRMSKSTLKRLIREGKFPRPCEHTEGGGVKVWPWHDCYLWVLLVEARPRMRASKKKT